MSASPILKGRRGGASRSVALILTLILLAVTSLMLVAFITTMGLDRTATFGYGQSLKAEQFGLGALQLVVGQLQLEMAKDALPDTGGGAYPLKPVYTNLSAANLLPQPVGTNNAMPLLVKTSSTNAPFTGTRLKGGVTASAVNSTAASQNGRSVPLSRWSQPYLGSFPSASSAPYWVLVTRAGPTNGAGMPFGAAGQTLNNPSAGNDSEVIGRFAYAVYDVGGLLDVTAAGHPTALTGAALQALKGTLAGANLSLVGVNPDRLVAWRNAATAASYADYVTNTAMTNGFLAVAPDDTTFLGRQDLINAAKKGVAGLTTASLTNLTVFTREKEAPSWTPSLNASAMGGSNGAKGLYAYANNAFSGTVNGFTNFNRAIPTVRRPGAAGTAYTVTSYRNDGSSFPRTVAAGDPVVDGRFPLGRLAWLTAAGPKTGVSDKAVQDCFGLKWDASQGVWQYVGPTGATEMGAIESLDQVAAETPRREPNFFELLQAGVLSGSLGVDAGMTDSNLGNLYQTNATLQILRIGAAIIDQANPASTPAVIEYNQGGAAWQAVGVKNLPYVNTVQATEGQSPDNAAGASCYFLFTFWNPNQGTASAPRPRVRLHVQGEVAMTSKAASLAAYGASQISNFGPGYLEPLDTTLELSTAAGAGVNGFTGSNTAGYVLLPTVNDVLTPPPAAGPLNAGGVNWVQLPTQITSFIAGKPACVGLRLPDLLFDMNNGAGLADNAYSISVVYGSTSTAFKGTKPFSVFMEFWNGSAWIPYQYLTRVNGSAAWVGGSYFQSTASVTVKNANPAGSKIVMQALNASFAAQTFIMMGCDPRSSRFGTWLFCPSTRNAATTAFYEPLLWNAVTPTTFSGGYGGLGTSGVQFYPTNFISGSAGSFYSPAALSRNNTANTLPNSSYGDIDGVRRIGDSGLAASTSSGSTFNPYWRVADRPVILNRPFYSVAELGYALRDNPWRSLDFWSTNSADSALLDLFTVNDASTNRFAAGRISLNGRSAVALAAVLADATIVDPAQDTAVSPVATVTTNNAMVFAAAMANFTSAPGGALVSRDQAATRLLPTLTNGFVTPDDQYIKARREALARALSDVGQTRTWNLMIDLVAQTGRYPAAATTLSDFIVEGERRYWLHVALDRVTGQVIDKRLEVVAQ